MCGLTCLCRLGEPKTDSAEVGLFILQAEQTNRTGLGLEGKAESGSARRAVGGGGRVLLDDLPDHHMTLDTDQSVGATALTRPTKATE